MFRNISKFILKYFEIYFEIFQKKCMPKSFERLRIFRKISRRSQFFRKISVRNFFRKISYIFFANVIYSDTLQKRTLTSWRFERKPTQTFLALRDFFGTSRLLSQFLNLQERELLLQRNNVSLHLFFFCFCFFGLFLKFFLLIYFLFRHFARKTNNISKHCACQLRLPTLSRIYS